MRPIDAVALTEGLELHRMGTDQEYEADRQWAVGYNAGLDRALYSIAYAKTITPTPPPNEALTLEQLREMDGETVWIVQINDELRPFWGLVDAEDESAASRLYCAMFEDYGTEWLAYRRKPEEGTA